MIKKNKIKYLEDINNISLNIAVTGESGVGKSTFLNAFRGIDNRDQRAAPTGVETTKPEPYPHPSHPNVTLWDLPGIGTTNFPADQYLEHSGFENVDFFIIVSADRFRENDAKLAQEIKNMDKKFYFVRSKIDNNLSNAKRGQREYDEEKTLQEIRDNCIQELEQQGVESPQVFLVSGFDLHLYDFPALQETMERELPSHKRDVLNRGIPKVCKSIINKKKEVFSSQIWYYALASAAVAAVPIPGLSFAADVGMLAPQTTRTKDVDVVICDLQSEKVCYTDRFTENEAKLAQEIKTMDKNLYFVRSKIDNNLEAAQRSQREYDEEKTLQEIRENCIEGLEKQGVASPQVFLVSSFHLQLHDFAALQKTMERELPSLKRNYLICNDLPLHIAVTGESGTGKSTFVNAFRGIDNTDERVAPTGVVETTMKPEPYPHPIYPNVTLWDLPGIGTTRFPADQYLKYVEFEKFDFFIIVSAGHFREHDAMLAQEIKNMGKKFYFVRSKIDHNLEAAQRSQREYDEEKTLQEVRENCFQGWLF
ncbi:unnamed protein product [Arctogadus glacialis]